VVAQKATGTLRLTLRGAEKTVYVKDGHPIYVQSSLNSEALGRFLVRKGILKETDLAKSLEELSSSDMRLGEILLKHKLIESSVLGGEPCRSAGRDVDQLVPLD